MNWDIISKELTFRTSRSSGAGGQHVNKTETKVEVLLDIRASAGLSEEEKEIVINRLQSRISDEGLLRVTSQASRSQQTNKELAIERLEALLIKALTPNVKRIKTAPSRQSIEDRLTLKKQQAEKKELRRKPRL